MAQTVKLAEYLFQRLRQLGIGAIHGVPGDYNLDLLDYVEPAGLLWVGNANELNAGYATDGYARVKGVGALITTFGVGELSAINAIAGAYAERAAVVHIVGTPPRASQDGRLAIHHTFNDGEFRRFAQMHSHVTVAQASLRDPRSSPEQIDRVLRRCLLHNRPVYIEVPVDLVAAPVLAGRLADPIRLPEHVPALSQAKALSEVLERIYAAKQPIVLVDGETRPSGALASVQKLVQFTGWPTWTTSFAKGLVDETWPNVHGIYRGSFSDPAVKAFVDGSDLVLCFGPHQSSTNSYAFTSITRKDVTIYFTDTEIQLGTSIFRDIPAQVAVQGLLETMDLSKASPYGTYPALPRDAPLPFSQVPPDQPIDQGKMWQILAGFLRPGDIVMGETGTAGYGVREMALPSGTRFFAPVTWLSIGYMLPAAQGAALALRELRAAAAASSSSSGDQAAEEGRTILFIGDGSFQMTVQELSTIVRHKLNVVIFLLNNDGYTIERCIHGLKQGYNDIAFWRYLQAPSFFGAREGTYTAAAKTWGELEFVLGNGELQNGRELRMVEIFLDREDAPPGPLVSLIEKQKASFSG